MLVKLGLKARLVVCEVIEHERIELNETFAFAFRSVVPVVGLVVATG